MIILAIQYDIDQNRSGKLSMLNCERLRQRILHSVDPYDNGWMSKSVYYYVQF